VSVIGLVADDSAHYNKEMNGIFYTHRGSSSHKNIVFIVNVYSIYLLSHFLMKLWSVLIELFDSIIIVACSTVAM
jgi:hypothetical protein